jgi:hypothetical protein
LGVAEQDAEAGSSELSPESTTSDTLSTEGTEETEETEDDEDDAWPIELLVG